MSIPIPLDRLRAALEERDGRAYVLTVSDDGRPHVVHGTICWEGDMLAADVGGRSAANAAARPSVSLLCPVRSAADYSLIVDGDAALVSHENRQRLPDHADEGGPSSTRANARSLVRVRRGLRSASLADQCAQDRSRDLKEYVGSGAV
jgi:hypothetical protein